MEENLALLSSRDSMEQNQKKKQTTVEKKLINVFHDYPQFVNAMTRIKKIRFREDKLNALELTKILKQFRPI